MLSQKGHAGAQAFLADLLWRGKYMKTDPVRALALISVAVANAPAYERVWIEDIYQNIYCGAAQGIRKQATGIVADWRTRYGRKPRFAGRHGPRRAQRASAAHVWQWRAGALRHEHRCSIRWDVGCRRRISAGSGGTSRRSRGARYLYQGLVRYRTARHRRQRQRSGSSTLIVRFLQRIL